MIPPVAASTAFFTSIGRGWPISARSDSRFSAASRMKQ